MVDTDDDGAVHDGEQFWQEMEEDYGISHETLND